MAQWYGNDKEGQIDPYSLKLPNVTISEVRKPANNNAETDSEDYNGDFYIDAVPEVMISDDVDRTDFFEKLNFSQILGKRPISSTGPKCCAFGCFNTSAKNRKGPKRKSFFPFPSSTELAEEWSRRTRTEIRIEDILQNPGSYWLCSDHFESYMFNVDMNGCELVPDAVPFDTTPFATNEGETVPYGSRKAHQISVQCPDCGKAFRDKFNLRKHMTKVNKCTDAQKKKKSPVSRNLLPLVKLELEPDFLGEDPLSGLTPKGKKPRVSCPVCGKSLGDAWKLKRHLSSLNKCVSRAWKCGACDDAYRTELELLGHITNHSEEEQTKAREGLAYAERGLPRPTNFPCLKCGTVFSDKWKVLRHNQRRLKCTAPKGEYHCSDCDKIYLKRIDWRKHVQEFHVIETLTGNQIRSDEEHSGSDGEESQNETTTEGGNEVWTCSVCRAIFSKLDHLKRHCTSVHQEVDWSTTDWMSCIEKVERIEDRGTPDVEVKPRIRKSVTERMPANAIVVKDGFECSVCLKKFSRRDHLKRHNDQFHPGEYGPAAKKHVCEVCDHVARDAWSLKKHQKSHFTPSSAKMKRSWQCTLCGVFLSKSADANLHISKHQADGSGEGVTFQPPPAYSSQPPIKLKIKLGNHQKQTTVEASNESVDLRFEEIRGSDGDESDAESSNEVEQEDDQERESDGYYGNSQGESLENEEPREENSGNESSSSNEDAERTADFYDNGDVASPLNNHGSEESASGYRANCTQSPSINHVKEESTASYYDNGGTAASSSSHDNYQEGTTGDTQDKGSEESDEECNSVDGNIDGRSVTGGNGNQVYQDVSDDCDETREW